MMMFWLGLLCFLQGIYVGMLINQHNIGRVIRWYRDRQCRKGKHRWYVFDGRPTYCRHCLALGHPLAYKKLRNNSPVKWNIPEEGDDD